MPAVNIKGVFNTSNETSYEKEPPAGMAYMSIQYLFLLSFVLQCKQPVSCKYVLKIFLLLFSGIAIDFNFYQTFWSLQVQKFTLGNFVQRGIVCEM